MISREKIWPKLALLLLTLTLSCGQAAAGYPDHPLHMIVPTGAGGITDVLARLVSDKLSQNLGQPVIVENRNGAGGIIGSDYVARAAPDGYTLLFVFPSHSVNPSLYAKIPYDTAAAFAPVTEVSTFPAILVVRADFPAHNLKELIAYGKSQSDPLNYGSVGNGSLGFLTAELFGMKTGIKLVQVAYKGMPQAMMGLMSGDTSLYFDTPVTALPLLKSGKVRALGVTSRTRLAVLPDVPAIDEVVSGYEAQGWNGVLAPRGTPDEIIAKLNTTLVTILKSPDVNTQLTGQGVEVVASSPEEFSTVIRTDIAKWGAVIRSAGIKPE